MRGSGSHDWRWRIGSILATLCAFLLIGFTAIERFPEYLGSIPELTGVRIVEGPVARVRDGDTIEIAGTAIRFGSLDCAENNTREGQAATARMRELVAGQSLICALNGRTSYDRSIGRCALSDGRDLAGVMIREGACRRFW